MLDSAMHQPANDVLRLTARELQVLDMTSRGLTNQQIAERLTVTVHAIKFHLATIYRKLNVSNRTEATFLYLNTNRAGSTTEGPAA